MLLLQENDVSVEVVIKEEIEDVEFSSPSPKSSAFNKNNTNHHSEHHHNNSNSSSSLVVPTGASNSGSNNSHVSNVQGHPPLQHSFYITQPGVAPNNNNNNGAKGQMGQSSTSSTGAVKTEFDVSLTVYFPSSDMLQ